MRNHANKPAQPTSPVSTQGGSRSSDFGGWPALWEEAAPEWRWGLEVQNQEHAFLVRAEAPGFDVKDFDLQLTGNQLILRASKKAEEEKKENGYRAVRRQEFYRTVALPEGIDANKVEARYESGILTVTLPKTAEGKAKKIPLKG